jgi:hypothetical protein
MPGRLILTSLIVAFATVMAPAAVSHASAARSCSLAGQERKLGPTYVTSLRVAGTSCRAGKRLVKSYYRCRVENGGKDGRCTSRLLGYKCSERRFNEIATQYDARVTCRKGSARVTHDYTQFT